MLKQTAGEKITYEVFHAEDDFFSTSLRYGKGEITAEEIRQAFDKGVYRFEGKFNLPAVELRNQLEEVFRITNQGKWGRPDSRSTSVGDVVRVQQQYWIVAPQGFDHGWQDD